MANKTKDKSKDRQWLSMEHQLWANILYTSSWLKHEMSKILAEVDLTVQQTRILIILHEQDGKPVSTNTLRDKILEVGSDTPKLVNRLIEKGLLNKSTSAVDKRLLIITLSDKGNDMIRTLMEDHLARIDKLLNIFTPDEVENFNSYLSRLHLGVTFELKA